LWSINTIVAIIVDTIPGTRRREEWTIHRRGMWNGKFQNEQREKCIKKGWESLP